MGNMLVLNLPCRLLLDGTVLIMVWCSLRKFIRETHGLYPSPLIRLLVRDAGIFYTTNLFSSAFGIICWTVFRNVRIRLSFRGRYSGGC